MSAIFLSVVIPAYNEESRIASTLAEAKDFLSAYGRPYEIIVVDDGSKDNGYAAAKKLAAGDRGIIVLKNGRNMGKGAAVKRGVMEAAGEYILFMDADSSTSINEAQGMLEFLIREPAYDFVIASRHVPGSKIAKEEPLLRVLLGRAYHFIVSAMFLGGISDYNCGFKLYRRDIAKKLFNLMSCADYTFDVELLYIARKLGYRHKEMPVTWQHNPDSKIRPFLDGIKSLASLMKIGLFAISKRYR